MLLLTELGILAKQNYKDAAPTALSRKLYFCESSNSFGDIEARQNPSVPSCILVTKGLKEFDEMRTKRTFAEIRL